MSYILHSLSSDLPVSEVTRAALPEALPQRVAPQAGGESDAEIKAGARSATTVVRT